MLRRKHALVLAALIFVTVLVLRQAVDSFRRAEASRITMVRACRVQQGAPSCLSVSPSGRVTTLSSMSRF